MRSRCAACGYLIDRAPPPAKCPECGASRDDVLAAELRRRASAVFAVPVAIMSLGVILISTFISGGGVTLCGIAALVGGWLGMCVAMFCDGPPSSTAVRCSVGVAFGWSVLFYGPVLWNAFFGR